MQTTIENKNYKQQVLREHYALNEGNETFLEWVELEAGSDPSLFRWLTGDDNISDFGYNLSEEERKEILSSLVD